MSDSAKRILRQEGRGFPPVGSAQRQRRCAPARRSAVLVGREGGPRRFETLLQFKGFAGGVPPNTERATVKPWVGIAR